MYGGRWQAARSGRTMASFNPVDGSLLATLPDGDGTDTALAVDAAQAAFEGWSQTTALTRARALDRIAQSVEAARGRLARMITQEMGKPLAESEAEVTVTVDFFAWYAEEARRAYGAWIPDPLPDRRLLTMRGPVGVCGAIIPWNVPLSMIARKVAPALAAGCTTVLKPAEQTPAVAALFAEALLEADVPPGVFNFVTGQPAPIGAALLGDPRVRKISFTGSTEIGRLLLRGAADHIKRTSMELGGNGAVVVFEDADLDLAVRLTGSLKFRCAGQTCVSANRIFVHERLHDAFVERLAAYAGDLVVGDGLDPTVQMGPLVEAEAVQRLEGLVADALAQGADLRAGGGRLAGGAHAAGHFFAPTVLSGVTPGMRVAGEEIFGPVAPVYRFATDAEAIARANAVPFGLAAYVFTQNLGRAIRAAETLETGLVGVNDIRISSVEAPFGGVKQSGLGREGGREGLDEYLETKLVALGLH